MSEGQTKGRLGPVRKASNGSLLKDTKKRTTYNLRERQYTMEEKALEIIQIMLSRRRKGSTKVEPISVGELENMNAYTIGEVLVIFSQKNSVLEKDVQKFINFAGENDYTNGLIVVSLSPPSENVLKFVKSQAKNRVQFFHIRQLQFDPTTHRLAMPHRILNEDEKVEVFKKYNIMNPEEQLPWIDSQDPMIKWIGALPGDVIEVERHSDTVGKSLYYRYCAEDVNVA
jgi:DNA-directed RNA polymerase subunit H (RpoH/RPB5)